MGRVERAIWFVLALGVAILALRMIDSAADHDRYSNPPAASAASR